jgi:hypothetical protein
MGRIDGNLIVGRITMLDGEIKVSQVNLQVRENEQFLDLRPEDACHFITIEFDKWGLYRDFRHGIGEQIQSYYSKANIEAAWPNERTRSGALYTRRFRWSRLHLLDVLEFGIEQDPHLAPERGQPDPKMALGKGRKVRFAEVEGFLQSDAEGAMNNLVRSRKPSLQMWPTFLENHLGSLVSVDFFTVPTVRFQRRLRLMDGANDQK